MRLERALHPVSFGTSVRKQITFRVTPAQPQAPCDDSDKERMEQAVKQDRAVRDEASAWSLQFGATSQVDAGRLVQRLTGGIFGCGGWVLSRAANQDGFVHMAFEFERHSCEDIYSLLVAAGLDISRAGHCRMTELCQCTRMSNLDCREDIVSVDLEIETLPAEFLGG